MNWFSSNGMYDATKEIISRPVVTMPRREMESAMRGEGDEGASIVYGSELELCDVFSLDSGFSLNEAGLDA